MRESPSLGSFLLINHLHQFLYILLCSTFKELQIIVYIHVKIMQSMIACIIVFLVMKKLNSCRGGLIRDPAHTQLPLTMKIAPQTIDPSKDSDFHKYDNIEIHQYMTSIIIAMHVVGLVGSLFITIEIVYQYYAFMLGFMPLE